MLLIARVALLSVVLGMLVAPIAFPREPKEPKAATLADPLIQQAVAATTSPRESGGFGGCAGQGRGGVPRTNSAEPVGPHRFLDAP